MDWCSWHLHKWARCVHREHVGYDVFALWLISYSFTYRLLVLSFVLNKCQTVWFGIDVRVSTGGHWYVTDERRKNFRIIAFLEITHFRLLFDKILHSSYGSMEATINYWSQNVNQYLLDARKKKVKMWHSIFILNISK